MLRVGIAAAGGHLCGRSGGADLHPRHRAHHLPELRRLPPSRRSRAVFAAELRRRRRSAPRRSPPSRTAATCRPGCPRRATAISQDEHRLTDAQIRLIADWVGRGSARRPARRNRRLRGSRSGWQLGPPDLVLEAPAPFPLPASGPDVFWNFVFRVNLPPTRYVRAIEIRPGDRRLVHHANLLVDRTAVRASPGNRPGQRLPGHGPDICSATPSIPTAISCSGSRAAHRTWSRDGLLLASRSRRRAGAQRAHAALRQTRAGASRDRAVFHGPAAHAAFRCWCSSKTTTPCTSRPARAISSSPTISGCPWTWTCWPSIRTRTIWASCWKPMPRCRTARAAG